ncbi:MAG TPA: HAMP domain-containing methyl-accepting chemotaxis protein [Sphingomicrobium sp.]|nr:HAMP domain-containing methyl-accepting chemotaxis protein [Sphingomicrobium sp.]
MKFAVLKDRFEKLRARADKRVEALSEASTGWKMNRKVGLTFGAIGLVMAALAIVTVGSILVMRASVGRVTDLSQANHALLRVQTQAVAAQGQLKDYVIRPDEKLTAQISETLDEALESLDDAEDGAEAMGESEALEAVRSALEATRVSADKIISAQRVISQQVDKELMVRGPAIAGTLRSIAKQTHDSGRAEASYSAGIAQAHYLEMRVNVTRYLSDSSPATAKMAKDNLLELEDGMNVLFEELEGTGMSGAADKVIAEVVAYDKAFDQVTASTNIRNREVDRTLRTTGPAIAQNAERILGAIERSQGGATLAAQATALTAVMVALLASAAGIVVALFAGTLTQRLIARPIAKMAERMRLLASGDLSIEISETGRTDEVGDMARAVEIFRANAREVDERRTAALEAERRELEREQELARERESHRIRLEAERREAMLALADSFEASVRHVVESVGASAKQIESGARIVSETVQQSGQLTAGVAAAATQASENSMIVASATEEMSISIAEVSQQIGGAAKVAQEASDRARSTDAIVSNLITDTRTIEDVVALIADVARQTNLLALNATIEASRAGDAGRGFAVVASEIKTLAGRTANATQEISSKIARARETTGLAANAITDIARTIDEISEIATVVACAMEQQKTTTAQIAESTSQAAHGSEDVARNITQVHHGVGVSGKAAKDALHAADDLNQQAETLKQAVDSFLSTVRAA